MTGQLEAMKKVAKQLADIKKMKTGDQTRPQAWDKATEDLDDLIAKWSKAQSKPYQTVPSVNGKAGRDFVKSWSLDTGSAPEMVASSTAKKGKVFNFKEQPAKAISLIDCRKMRQNGLGYSPILKRDGGRTSYDYEDTRVVKLQRLHDTLYAQHCILLAAGPKHYREAMKGPLDETGRTGITSLESWRNWIDATSDIKADLGTGVSPSGGTAFDATAGAEWVPTGFSSQIVDAVFLELAVAGLFEQFTMPTNPFAWPTSTARPIAKSPAPNVAPSTDAGIVSANQVMLAAIFKTFQDFSDEIEEDAAFALAGWLQGTLITALARGIETVALNGDGDGTHQDFDVQGGAADLAQKAFDGLRKAGNVVDLAQPATFTFNNLTTIRNALDSHYLADPSKLAWITSSAGFMLNFMDITELRTLDVFGPQATILTGQIAAAQGIPLIVSSEFPENLDDATGFNLSGGSNDTTGILCVYRDAWTVGTVRNSRVDLDYEPKAGTRTVVASTRVGFLDTIDASTENHTAYGIDIAA